VRGRIVLLLSACALTAASGCGAARQDKGEPKGSFTMKVLKASFPARQSIAKLVDFELEVENAGADTAPNVRGSGLRPPRQGSGPPKHGLDCPDTSLKSTRTGLKPTNSGLDLPNSGPDVSNAGPRSAYGVGTARSSQDGSPGAVDP